ncbi:hypothetical protein SAMN05421640_3696 [Ekhidna lutea]|uniref:Uncharacterized protein n=1 Tax=Ekhidna lutea TaxID=447679 RepID=A0A239M7J2_EKHLU|nr:hypothetical protein [Ekhidna lutea]SNT38601.1 hypothetical protein SAMN05421640_3696 [Ekhidna lutea]
MLNIQPLSSFILLVVSLSAFSQESNVRERKETGINVNKNTSETDSLTAQKRTYEERLKRAELFKKRMARNPKKFMDSLNSIKNEKLRIEALQRIESYKIKSKSAINIEN